MDTTTTFSDFSRQAPKLPRGRSDAEKTEGAPQYDMLRMELLDMAKKQRQRIHELRQDTAVSLEHSAALARSELLSRRDDAQRLYDSLIPQVERVRTTWATAREQTTGFESQWGHLRQQHEDTLAHVETLREHIVDDRAAIDRDRESIAANREPIRQLASEKAALRANIKRALECLVVDDGMLTSRCAEEERYLASMGQVLEDLRHMYAAMQRTGGHDAASLEADVSLLNAYLQDMQTRTRELLQYRDELERTNRDEEEKWIQDTHKLFAEVQTLSILQRLRGAALAAFERETRILRAQGCNEKFRTSDTDVDWLSMHVGVWELALREVGDARTRVLPTQAQLQNLANASQAVKSTHKKLTSIKQTLDAPGRKDAVVFIHHLTRLLEERASSLSSLDTVLLDTATSLDEDLATVSAFVRREGYDDYVSSTDSDSGDDEHAEFPALEDEGEEEVAQLTTTYEIQPEKVTEMVKMLSQRPRGPLETMRARLSIFVPNPDMTRSSSRGATPMVETLNRAVAETQKSVLNEVVKFVRQRKERIENGQLNPRTERINADPRYVEEVRSWNVRVGQWVETHRNTVDFNTRESSRARRIIVDGAKLPPDVLRGSIENKCHYFLGSAVRGVRVTYVTVSQQTELRTLFLSVDLRRIVIRQVGLRGVEHVIRVEDVHDVQCGVPPKMMEGFPNRSVRRDFCFSIVSSKGDDVAVVECHSVEDRSYWAAVVAWVVNESHPGGIISTLLTTGRIEIVDGSRQQVVTEPIDRSRLKVSIRHETSM